MKGRKKFTKYQCMEERTKGRGIIAFPSSTFLDGKITDIWFTRLHVCRLTIVASPIQSACVCQRPGNYCNRQLGFENTFNGNFRSKHV